MQTIIAVKNVKKGYPDKPVLTNLTFEVRKGECYGLLGENGAGKSTTIDCILGLKNVDQGSITLFDQKVGSLSKTIFEKIGVQFQQSHYSEKITIAELCKLTTSYYQQPQSWETLLVDFGLIGKEKQKVESLSGGEKQKLSVLLTLIPNPDIIFLDELTTGLDALARRQVWNILKQLKKQGLTILLTSHYMDEVEVLCDQIGIIADGKMIVQGNVEQVIAQAKRTTLEEAYLCYTGEVEQHESF